MALHITDAETEKAARELASITGETVASAVKTALEERRARLRPRAIVQDRGAALQRLLEDEIWPQVPPEALGIPLSRGEVLGYGPEGV